MDSAENEKNVYFGYIIYAPGFRLPPLIDLLGVSPGV